MLILIGQCLIQGLMMGSIFGFVTIGMVLIYRVTKLLNFSHGAWLMVAMYISYILFVKFRIEPYLSVLIAFPALFLLAALVYYVVMRPLGMKGHIIMMCQVSLGLLWILENSALLVFKADYRSVQSVLSNSKFYIGPLIIKTPLFIAFLTVGIIAIVLGWVLYKTDFGLSVRAISQHEEAAKLMGINIGRIQLLVFAIGIAIMGIAGPLLAPWMVITPHAGAEFTFLGFVILILAGLGNLNGALIGGLIIGIAESFGSTFMPGALASVPAYVIFILVLCLRPQGLFGAR